MVIFNGHAMSILIQSLRNWRDLLWDSIPMVHSTIVKLCTYFSEDTISGAAKLCSDLQNNESCATDANEMWYRCVRVNKEILALIHTKQCLLKLAVAHSLRWSSQFLQGVRLQLNAQVAGILGAQTHSQLPACKYSRCTLELDFVCNNLT